MLGNSAGGREEVDAEPHSAIAVVREVDRTPRDRAQLRRGRGELSVEDAMGKRRRTADVHHRRGQALELPAEELRRGPLALQAVTALIDAQRQARCRPAERFKSGRCRANASSSPLPPIARSIERLVPIIAGISPSAGAMTRAATSNLLRSGSASRWRAMRSPPLLTSAFSSTSARPEWTSALPHKRPLRGLPLTCRSDVEPVDAKLADVDVEAGEDRALLRARLEPRQPNKGHPLRGDAIDVQLVFEPCPWRPVELDVGRGRGTRRAGRRR